MTETFTNPRLEGDALIIDTDEGSVRYDSRFLVAALLMFIARGSGTIEPEETSKMIELLGAHFHMQSAEALELLTSAIEERHKHPELGMALVELGKTLSDPEKEDLAVMALKVIAADGRREVSEMEQFNLAAEALEISEEVVRRGFERYFNETLVDDEDDEAPGD